MQLDAELIEHTDMVLPSCPEILTELFSMLGQSDLDLRNVAALIAADPALFGMVLRKANSVTESRQASLRDPLQAVTRLGVQRVLSIASAVAAPSAFPELPHAFAERFWQLSRATAEAARLVSHKIPGHTEDDAYLFGLFRDCGIPLLMIHHSDYQDMLQEAITQNVPSTHVEYQRYDTNHALVGGLIALHWKMPDEIVLAIRHQHDAVLFGEGGGTMPPHIRTLAAMGFFAAAAARHALGEIEDPEWTWCGRQAATYLGYNSKEAEELVQDVAEALREVKQAGGSLF